MIAKSAKLSVYLQMNDRPLGHKKRECLAHSLYLISIYISDYLTNCPRVTPS